MSITRRDPVPPAQAVEPLSDWEPLSWLRAWEFDQSQHLETMANEPVRDVNHIHESIFLASFWAGFML
jgi:hypothetical protein